MGEYIPVKDFADMVGVTIGAVYKRNKDGSIKEYTQGEKGDLKINTDAVKLFKPRKYSGVDNNTPVDSSRLEKLDLMYSVLQSTIQELSTQLQVKDKQLAEKDTQIAEKDKQLEKMNDHLTYMHKLTEQRNQSEIVDKVQLVVDGAADAPAKKKTIGEILMFWKRPN